MLKSIRIKNFKSIQDSKKIRLTPLTVFIGNNGSGKSSIIEGLETYKIIIESGLHEAMLPWRGFEHIRNKAVPHNLHKSNGDRPYETNPIEFNLAWQNYHTAMTINLGAGGNEQFIQAETITISEKGASKRIIDRTSFASADEHQNFYPEKLPDDLSLISLDRKFHSDLYQNLSH